MIVHLVKRKSSVLEIYQNLITPESCTMADPEFHAGAAFQKFCMSKYKN